MIFIQLIQKLICLPIVWHHSRVYKVYGKSNLKFVQMKSGNILMIWWLCVCVYRLTVVSPESNKNCLFIFCAFVLIPSWKWYHEFTAHIHTHWQAKILSRQFFVFVFIITLNRKLAWEMLFHYDLRKWKILYWPLVISISVLMVFYLQLPQNGK